MFDFHDFDQVFEFDTNLSYDSESVAGIEADRKTLEGLFIDKVLKLIGIKRRRFMNL